MWEQVVDFPWTFLVGNPIGNPACLSLRLILVFCGGIEILTVAHRRITNWILTTLARRELMPLWGTFIMDFYSLHFPSGFWPPPGVPGRRWESPGLLPFGCSFSPLLLGFLKSMMCLSFAKAFTRVLITPRFLTFSCWSWKYPVGMENGKFHFFVANHMPRLMP